MTFAGFYPRLDKICDAGFIKTLMGSTKKDAITIIQHCNIGEIFEKAEKKFSEAVNSIRYELEEGLRSHAVKAAIVSYKQDLKQKALINKKEKEKQEREEIIKEYKRQLRERHSLVSVVNDDNDNDNDNDNDDDDKIPPDRNGPAMTLQQFEVLMQNAILDEKISFKIKLSENLGSKPTIKIVDNQLEVTIKFQMAEAHGDISVPKSVV
jgi:hypothetical protein